jgi:hypothetical protein
VSGDPFEGVDELIVAHPSRVAHADQVQAAEPRLERSQVVLRDFVPTSHVYVLNLAYMREHFGIDRMRP